MSALFGLDIGSSAIKIVQLSGKNVTAAGMIANPTGRVGVDLVPTEQAAVMTNVKTLLSQLKIKSRRAVVSIPESLVYTRVMQFPFMSTPELATAVKWEAEQAIPYPIDKMELSWIVLFKPKSSSGGEKMKVLVVGVPTKVSEAYVNFMDVLGLEPIRMENEVLASIRSLVSFKKLGGVYLLIDIGQTATKIVITSKDEIYTNYVSPLGSGAFTKIIADVFKLNLNQAEEYKRTYGLDKDQLEGKIVTACEPVSGGLIGDIKKVIVSYQAMSLNRPLERAIVVGGGAFMRGLLPRLTAELGMELVMGNAFEGLKVAENLMSLGVVYANAVGLAIEEI